MLLILTQFSNVSCQTTDSLKKSQSYKVGKVSFDEILDSSEKFKKAYDNYSPTKDFILSNEYHFVIVFGFWCHDSKREIPRLLKTLKLFSAKDDNIFLYSTDRKKEKPADIIEKYEVHYSPTIIFYKGEKEIRRFVEFPDTSWELDIIKYCSNKE